MLERRNLKKTLLDTCQTGAWSRRSSGPRARRALALASIVLGLWACSRTGIELSDLEPFSDDFDTGGTAGEPRVPPGDASSAGMPPDAGPDADADIDADTDADSPPDDSPDPTVPPPDPDPEECVPAPETCNERDDDCDGQVDDLPGEPCPGGGFSYCIAGRMSECPRSCEVCVPGSLRICWTSFCTFWGEQECAADGQGFGPCREGPPPPRCKSVALREHDSPELEQCCIDDGYCCLDTHDLDHDGNRQDMVGACDGVRCP